ncbi:MAG: hypothetical protein IPK44_23565 [Candidatus Accumulibacter sp.]|uniref:CARDB domain-containing protein n=1 Tax=Accumulibacter sp. TaxID=2053492 RepID=UPI0025857ADA|nr:CARDB domain-containing protein [Accumulibacter sp.]MBK8117271.1 hypothetical protein [Accumulibacter sp.]
MGQANRSDFCDRAEHRNGGGGRLKIHYYLSTDNVLSSADTLLGYNYVSSIAASGSASISATVYVASSQATGAYYLIAAADGDDDLTETSETNNLRSIPINVGQPDLTVSALTTNKTTYGAGETVTISATTTNAGTGGAGNYSTTKFYLSKDTVWDSSDAYLGYDSVNPWRQASQNQRHWMSPCPPRSQTAQEPTT